MSDTQEKHCPTCICGRRAPVQGSTHDRHGRPAPRGPGTISWDEHERAWAAYALKYGRDQSAQRIADRGGFGWTELVDLLGHEPTTWAPAGAVTEREHPR
jgi:hypothetical protein